MSGGGSGGGAPGFSIIEFPIYEPLADLTPEGLNYGARFPESSWGAPYIAQLALFEFARQPWQDISLEGPPDGRYAEGRAKIFQEMDELGGPDLDRRRLPKMSEEILDQMSGIVEYFAQFLMLSPSQQNTLRVMEMADQAGFMAAMYFKAKYNRARPQQVSPALFPLIPTPGHPAWPSGHALESHMIALALMQVLPKNAHVALVALADRIGKNREFAGVHYKSDTAAGKEIAGKVFPFLQKCPTFQRALKDAQAEHQ